MTRRAFPQAVLLMACLVLAQPIFNSGTGAQMAEAMAPASAVTLLEPVSESVVYSVQPRYVWARAAGTDSMSGLQYELHVSSDSDFTAPEVVDSLVDTTRRQLSPLQVGTRHWWKVISRDSLGVATESAVSSFYTYLPGDVNESHDITTADIIRMVNFVFKSASLGVPECAADIDGEAEITSGDIIRLVAYTFRGGMAPAPRCFPEGSTYWPLAEGNYWLYEFCWGQQPCVDSAHLMAVVHRGADTAIVVGQPWWNDTIAVRRLGPAIDWRWPDTDWTPFYRFDRSPAVRAQLPSPCNDSVFGAFPESDSIVTPAGTFHGCLRVQSAKLCFDAGMIAEWWAPGVGLVAWVQDNVGGYQYYYLTEYRAELE